MLTPCRIGHKLAEKAFLPELQASKGIIARLEALAPTNALGELHPVYTAIFTFADQDGDVRLSASWQKPETTMHSNDYGEATIKWSRLDKDSTGGPAAVFDVSLVNLNSGSAWQFDILASHTVDTSRMSPLLTRFAENLKIDPVAAEQRNPESVFVRNIPYGTLRSLQQRISYRYGIVDSPLTLEVSHFQDRIYSNRGSSGGAPTIREPRCSLSVYRAEWDTMFARNQNLPVGEVAVWNEAESEWFPDEGDINGWTHFLERLDKVEAFVQAVMVKVNAEEEDLEDSVFDR